MLEGKLVVKKELDFPTDIKLILFAPLPQLLNAAQEMREQGNLT